LAASGFKLRKLGRNYAVRIVEKQGMTVVRGRLDSRSDDRQELVTTDCGLAAFAVGVVVADQGTAKTLPLFEDELEPRRFTLDGLFNR
jgi:hypothetical protein